MPFVASRSPAPPATSYGQIIEYIQDRLYLAAYTHPPNDSTPFPYSPASRSPSKRSSKSQVSSRSLTAPALAPVYFSIDDTLLYNRFHADFGPLHIGHLYRFAVQLHDILGDPQNTDRAVVFWSKADPRARANAACMLACYMVLIQSWPPHLALAPIAQADPPLMPFRDAGYSQADYALSVQDVVYGVWKAKEDGLCGLKDFSLEESVISAKFEVKRPLTMHRYERYERVDQGDFNWITPQFLAFASPQSQPTAAVPRGSIEFARLPTTVGAVRASSLSGSFQNVLCHFKERNIGLVVRLNSELYSPSYFTALGIEHVDMIFDDGTCPPLPLVKRFIRLAHDTIERQKKSVAVHCKAGLGRTGCLIGAYLIYRWGFNANDLIAFMRFMRPGMVVGPQQHWLHINQGAFRQWWWEDTYKEKLAALMPTTPTKTPRLRHSGAKVTPPVGENGVKRAALGEINCNEGAASPAAPGTAMEDCLPAPTPGQPRKTSRVHGSARGSRSTSAQFRIVEDAKQPPSPIPEREVVEMHRHRRNAGREPGEEDEEWQLRRISRRTSSRSPVGATTNGVSGSQSTSATISPSSAKRRAVSYTTTTTTTTFDLGSDPGDTDADEAMASGLLSDVENWTHDGAGRIDDLDSKGIRDNGRPNSPRRTSKSGNGSGTIGMTKVRTSPLRRRPESRDGSRTASNSNSNGVRKTSGRVGSVGGPGPLRA